MRELLRKFRGNKDGTLAMVVAIALPVIIGALAVSIEAGYWMKSKKDLQMTADLAAYSGTLELQDYDSARAITAAKLDALNNGFTFNKGTIIVNSPPTSGNYAGLEAVEVLITQKGNQYFSGIFGDNKINYSVRAVSAITGGASFCAMALNPAGKKSFKISGIGSLALADCSIAALSTAADAVYIQGSLDAECIYTVGGIDDKSGATLDCDAPETGSTELEDPYSYLLAPDITAYPTCETPTSTGPNTELTPGRYCGADLQINGAADLLPGTYIIDAIDFGFNSGASLVRGTGVTFILMNGATMTGFNKSSNINLSAPATGPYSGVVIFSDPITQDPKDRLIFNGNGSLKVEGLLYLPTQEIQYGGGASSLSDCTIIVADYVHITGNSKLEMSKCGSDYGLKVPGTGGVYLVE